MPATSKTICIGSAYWRRNARHRDSVLPSANFLGPNRSARDATSAELRPRCPSTCSACRTRSALSACHTVPPTSGTGAGDGRLGRSAHAAPARVTTFVPAFPATIPVMSSRAPTTARLPVFWAKRTAASTLGPMDPAGNS